MKKALPIVLVLAALVAAFVFFKNRRGGNLDLPPGRAAELAPAETVLFVEAPDIARTRERWVGTSLHKIAQEPEWKEFAAKWDDFVANNEVARETFGVIGEIEKADPAGLFLAVTEIDANGVKLVGGFPYRGRKGDVEGVVRKLREQIVKAWPAAKSELTTYEGVEIETLKDPKFTAAMAYLDNWFFFANDTDLLLKTLSRYQKKPGALASLAGDTVWKSSSEKGSKDPDLRVWARWSVFAEKFAALGAMAMPGGASPAKDPNPAQAITYTWKLDGPVMRDRVFFQTEKPVKAEPYANRLLAFTNPATYAYVGMNVAGMQDYTTSMMQALHTMGVTQRGNEALAPKGVKLDDIFTTFGPEIAMMSAWEAGGIALPDFFAVVEVKDPKKARAFAEFFADNMDKGTPIAPRTLGETTVWTADAEVPIFKPTLAINNQHMIFALNPTALEAGMKQLSGKGPNLTTAPGSPYPAALKTVVAPTVMVLYVDMKTLFERLYDKLKPMIAFSLVGNPEAAKYFDAGKLPQAGTISKHLAPIIMTYAAEDGGWVVEATGSVSFLSTYMTALPAALLGVRAARPAPPMAAPSPANTAPARVQPSPAEGAPAPAASPSNPPSTNGNPAGAGGNPPKNVPVPRLLLPAR